MAAEFAIMVNAFRQIWDLYSCSCNFYLHFCAQDSRYQKEDTSTSWALAVADYWELSLAARQAWSHIALDKVLAAKYGDLVYLR